MYKDVAGPKIELNYPRRGRLPDAAALNGENYDKIKATLLAQPGYGTNLDETLGRQWWDAK